MNTISAKSILSARKPGGWFGSDYTMNLYRGCCHGCIYCDSRSDCYGIEVFSEVQKKQDALLILERELKTKRHKGLVLTGSMSDPYNPFEAAEQLTRGALALLSRYAFGAIIITKSDLVVRDLELLRAIATAAPVAVNFTITTLDPVLCSKIEPYAPSAQARLQAMEQLSRGGISCGVTLMPLLPFLNDTLEYLLPLVSRCAQAGAKWIYAQPGFPVSLRDRQRDYYYAQLDRLFPGLKQRYIQHFGDDYWCPSPNPALWPAFQAACKSNGLLWQHEEINAYIQRLAPAQQISLFH